MRYIKVAGLWRETQLEQTEAVRMGYDFREWEEYNGEWCTDCLMMDANGTIGDSPDLDQPAADEEHRAMMGAQWPPEEGWELSNNCGEDCEGHFSWSRCHGCGSTLGGDRHPFVAMRRQTHGRRPRR